MKTDYGWNNDNNGTNTSGFAALPGGWRGFLGAFSENDGSIGQGGTRGHWWSSTPSDGYTWNSDGYTWNRYISTEVVVREFSDRRVGFSVRCIKDAE